METENKTLAKYLFQIRTAPYPKMLDMRGKISSDIVDSNLFDTWRIDTNRIDFTRKDNPNVAGFISFKDFGLAYENPDNKESFTNLGKSFIKSVWNIVPPKQYIRFGVRTTYVVPRSDSLEKINKSIRDKFFNLNGVDLEKFEADLVDIAVPLNFKENDTGNKFNINFGAMEKEQSKQFFVNEDLLPDLGVFLDIDYFQDSKLSQKQKDFGDFIDKALLRAEKTLKVLLEITEGEKTNG